MTAITLGAAAARLLTGGGRAAHRTGAPVRRDSIEAGTFETFFFAEPAPGECDRLMRTARAALDTARRLARVERAGERALTGAERLLTGLTAGAVRVYEELCLIARLNRGRVYPSYDALASATGLGRATVARALAALERIGFLVRQRRFARIAGEGAGPRYAQTSNAYRACAPQRILGLLPRRFRPAPVPCDTAWHAAAAADAAAAMRATLGCRELAEASVGGALGRMLARLGAAIDARESHDDPEPHRELNDQLWKDVGLDGQRRPA